MRRLPATAPTRGSLPARSRNSLCDRLSFEPLLLPPTPFRKLVMQTVRHVPGTREHHMLEQVGEPRSSRYLVLRAHVVPNVNGDRRRCMIDREESRSARSGACSSQNGILIESEAAFTLSAERLARLRY